MPCCLHHCGGHIKLGAVIIETMQRDNDGAGRIGGVHLERQPRAIRCDKITGFKCRLRNMWSGFLCEWRTGGDQHKKAATTKTSVR